MGTLLLAVGVGLAAAGSIKEGQAAESAAKDQQNLLKFNAAIEKREGEAAKQAAAFAGKRHAKKAAEIKSSQIVALGTGLGSPVAGDLAAEQAAELELEELLIGFEGEVAQRRAGSQAQLDIASGKAVRARGKSRKEAGFIKAGTSLLQGFA